MNPPAIRFERVTKVYQNRQVALADVSFEVPAGATVGLLGANGSGKSTSIGIALGLVTPSAGHVEVLGQPMTPGAKATRQRLGFLSDDPSFPKDLNAIQYLDFVGRCYGLPRLEQKARMGTLLRTVGLTDDASRRIGTYSTGMKTRLGVAASLMNHPEMLFWDEPTAGLDPISRMQTLDLLEKFRGNKTVVLSSHILGDIDRVCDRLIILNKGQLLFDGPRAELENMLPHRVLDIRANGSLDAFRADIEARMGRKIFSHEPGRIRIELDSTDVVGEVTGQLLELARAHDVTISGINSIGRQLEDAYLKLITEDEFRGFERVSSP
ncbi:ATP-binding cassette domain-containing protein [bacterium]|nr:ATP-binding cassette domain-containing protein [bacterium]